MSTPAVSAIIRKLNADHGENYCVGGILLTASHNPGGEHEDFGIKFNSKNGGPALESLTNRIFDESKSISSYRILEGEHEIDLSIIETHDLGIVEGFDHNYKISVIDSCNNYIELMKTLFDFDKLKKFIGRKDFNMLFDSMHGAAGPYAKRIFGEILGVDEQHLLRCNVLHDFGGGHPDPNLTYAADLVKRLGVFDTEESAFDFGAACDGDADRNMILGKNFFVTPSDSIAVLAANYKCIPFLKDGITGAARSMPTSAALDKVM